ADDTVLAVCADKEGGVWFSTIAGGVQHFDGKKFATFNREQGLAKAPVTAMCPSSAGGLWFGTQDGLLFSEKNGKFTLAQSPQIPGARSVLALHEGEGGRLWIGTAGGGLSCLANGIYFNWTMSNGLPSDVIVGVVEDNAKNLWLVTDTGIFRINH